MSNEFGETQNTLVLETGAVVYSYYEEHDKKRLYPDNIHPIRDFFIEVANIYKEGEEYQTPKYILNATNFPYGQLIIPEHVQKTLKTTDGRFCIADFYTPSNIAFLNALVIGISGSLPIGFAIYRMIEKNPQISRRDFLKFGALAIPLITWELTQTEPPLLHASVRSNQSGRIDYEMAKELLTIKGRIHPEDLRVFFRSLLWAHKILSYSEDPDHKEIGMESGTSHVVTEYFLRKGKIHCQNVLRNFPPRVLQTVIEENGSLENVCTVLSCQIKDANNPLTNFTKFLDEDLYNIIKEIIHE